ncbi:conserved hypothetical protein [metagenome]|uniref:DnaJ homologue subfamily C member 28 conserved domain-containing protein n=1 Tax=metagenome TaxID=256318 RepID=A0A2P2C3H8_9ZZZZ
MGEDDDTRTGGSAAEARIRHQARWVDLQIEQAMARGEFDNLPGQGKPIEDLGSSHDPDWWLKKLVDREQISVLPPALALRKEDVELDATVDRLAGEAEVRRELESFNERVRRARMQLTGGPPVVTAMRDVDAEVAAWSERRRSRLTSRRADEAPPVAPRRRRWFRRR